MPGEAATASSGWTTAMSSMTTAGAGPEWGADVVVVGGAGHVGAPLATAFASRGLRTVVFDVNPAAVEKMARGQAPFRERGLERPLAHTVRAGLLTATTDPKSISEAEHVVIVIGTPVDEHLNPDPHVVPETLKAIGSHLRHGQHLVLRSTVYPGVTRKVEALIQSLGLCVDVTFCPERIAEGRAMTELFELPQIVSGRTPAVRERARVLFEHLTEDIVELVPEEAELAKLFTNTWRYIKFAAANQFYVMANDHGLDYDVIRRALAFEYPRAKDMPGAGFAAGPCLLKDTMQLAAFADNSFVLGHSAMLVNEGLPLYLVSRLEKKYRLENLTVGILGMAFKGESDDTRASLSYKLKRILQFRAGRVLCTDPYVATDAGLSPLNDVLDQADILIIGAPHREYQNISAAVEVVDVWNLMGKGTTV